MCTAITLQSIEGMNIFGRTMDFSHPIMPGIFVIPKGYRWNSLTTSNRYVNEYSFLALGQQMDGMLSFFDGVNEKGVAAAVLYFAGYADYTLPKEGKKSITSLDVLHFILGNCQSVDEIITYFQTMVIVGFEDPVTQTVAPLHWIATDQSGKTIVMEQSSDGLHIYDNPIGVMTNSPTFPWHMTNLKNYIHLSTTQKTESTWGDVSLTPFGQGAGSFGLPGGFTSPERFVRAAFLRSHVPQPKNKDEAISTAFHIAASVFIPKGIVTTASGVDDYTKYTAFINTKTLEYYIRTYENSYMRRISLWDYCTLNPEPNFLGYLVGV